VDGVQRADAEHLKEVMTVVIWFLAICSIVSLLPYFISRTLLTIQVVHGLSIPLGKLGFFLPRTLSRAFTSQANSPSTQSFTTADRILPTNIASALRERRNRRSSRSSRSRNNSRSSRHSVTDDSTPGLPIYRIGGTVIKESDSTGSPIQLGPQEAGPDGPPQLPERTIRFPDEEGISTATAGGRV
jgi:hypothetical protein